MDGLTVAQVGILCFPPVRNVFADKCHPSWYFWGALFTLKYLKFVTWMFLPREGTFYVQMSKTIRQSGKVIFLFQVYVGWTLRITGKKIFSLKSFRRSRFLQNLIIFTKNLIWPGDLVWGFVSWWRRRWLSWAGVSSMRGRWRLQSRQ